MISVDISSVFLECYTYVFGLCFSTDISKCKEDPLMQLNLKLCPRTLLGDRIRSFIIGAWYTPPNLSNLNYGIQHIIVLADILTPLIAQMHYLTPHLDSKTGRKQPTEKGREVCNQCQVWAVETSIDYIEESCNNQSNADKCPKQGT